MKIVHYLQNPFERRVAICGIKEPGHHSDYMEMVTCKRCLNIWRNPLTKRARTYIEWNPYHREVKRQVAQ